ncbi:hypothetical protein BOX15_Mlig003758g1 [Macrostomum lignano]|uniref:K Homology domain-containing protein n=2 Tax=Macrostomum lignano TaxID=282301 RepID=A0A267EKT7_9PLAT|nr:hypothetical protein BOX15_Mlig003758g1 [Macrostomum lignano]
MSESIGDSQIQSVPFSDSAAFSHPSAMLSADSTKNQLAFSDYLSAFSGVDFHGLNLDLDNIIPYMQASQNSPSAMALAGADQNGHGHAGMYENVKLEDQMYAAGNASQYQSNRNSTGAYPGSADMNYAFNPLSGNTQQFSQMNCNYPGMIAPAKPVQYGATDFESLQQKISQKKQTLDILQGVLPDPLANQEKRYMTITERIQVPSSDHVAEIVGKNGQRIKQLREQLKVWVKTPSRDEPPIFEVTGLPEKLAEAKRIILQMSEHFTKVQQERLHRVEPNRIEDRLYVEQDKVGLIVGASGQTIRWVQQLSDTHIATPRKQESIPGLPPPQTYFTICGTPDKVKFAKQLICEYVTLRCQGLWLDPDLEPSAEASKLVRDFHQRRQVEDNQRRTAQGSPPASNTPVLGRSAAAAAGRPLVGAADGDHNPASVKQLISEMDDLWGSAAARASAPTSSAGSSGQESPRRYMQTGVWNPMMYSGGPSCLVTGDRRFSADAQHAGSAAPGTVGAGAAASAMTKSRSDEQVSPQPPVAGAVAASGFRPGPGWM